MPYRNVFITNDSALKLKNNQLIVFNGEEYSFPVEDVRSVVVDNPCTTLSARLISYLAENGVCLIICDQKHMPSAQLMPMSTYCRVNKRINLQNSQSLPKLKRIWQKIVVSKIENQAKCLELLCNDNFLKIKSIAGTVQSGDVTNREGYAASLYFKFLFGKDFVRGEDNIINAGLNYGYAVFRSYIAKTLAAYGLEPSLGIHHKNQLNAYNLADDIIEPFRPIVDFFVASHCDEWENFGTVQKAQLVGLLNCAVKCGEERYSVAHAMEFMIQSLIFSYENDCIELKLPTVGGIAYFDYD